MSFAEDYPYLPRDIMVALARAVAKDSGTHVPMRVTKGDQLPRGSEEERYNQFMHRGQHPMRAEKADRWDRANVYDFENPGTPTTHDQVVRTAKGDLLTPPAQEQPPAAPETFEDALHSFTGSVGELRGAFGQPSVSHETYQPYTNAGMPEMGGVDLRQNALLSMLQPIGGGQQPRAANILALMQAMQGMRGQNALGAIGGGGGGVGAYPGAQQ